MDLKELDAIANRELSRHGLNGWTFALATTKRRLGVCKYRTKRIEIAEFHAANNPPPIVLDTLLHEIAHALAGPAARHGPKWKAIAARLGASPTACDDSPETAHSPGDWQATCPTCNRTFHRYKRPKMLSGYSSSEDMRESSSHPLLPRSPNTKSPTIRGCGRVDIMNPTYRLRLVNHPF